MKRGQSPGLETIVCEIGVEMFSFVWLLDASLLPLEAARYWLGKAAP